MRPYIGLSRESQKQGFKNALDSYDILGNIKNSFNYSGFGNMFKK